MKLREHWEVRLKDTDPDTGDTTQDIGLAITRDEKFAVWIKAALEKYEDGNGNDPNRDYYIRHIPNTIL